MDRITHLPAEVLATVEKSIRAARPYREIRGWLESEGYFLTESALRRYGSTHGWSAGRTRGRHTKKVYQMSEPLHPDRPVVDRATRWVHYAKASRDYRAEYLPDPLQVVDLGYERNYTGIAYISDTHIGNKWVDYETLTTHLTALLQSGVYVILGGDLIHNHKRGRKSGNALYETIGSPDEQWQWMTDLFTPLIKSRRILGCITGNHEHFDVEEAGVHLMRQWCTEHRIAYWGHGGVVRFDLADLSYYGAVRHEYPGSSALNTTNNQRRLIAELRRPAEAGHLDFVCLGHLHYHDLHMMRSPTGKVAAVRAGTYALYSEWADQRFGGGLATPGAPLFVLSPDTRKVVAWEGTDLQHALEYLAWRQGCHRQLQESETAT